MRFEKGYIYHIYNQGNNKQKIFFGRNNYLFFLRKLRTYISPYCDILAWCLMPNHFHLMVVVNEITVGVAQSDTDGSTKGKIRTLNDSIGIMLRSYTNAINKQQLRSGKLIREKTKAECVNCPKGLTPSFIIKVGLTLIHKRDSESQYPQLCFDYIHQNPVKANLVDDAIKWEFSSAMDYQNLRKGKLINKLVAAEYLKI